MPTWHLALCALLWMAMAGCSVDGSDSGDGGDAGQAALDGAASVGDGAAIDDAGAPDAGPEDTGDPLACIKPGYYDYSCELLKPGTCPGGLCAAGLCLGPEIDPDRWKDCGNGSCEECETEESCPVDCAEPFSLTGSKDYTADKTITIWVHGFSNNGKDELESGTFGDEGGCKDELQAMVALGIDRPCGPGNAPNQLVAVEYYGAQPPAWMSPEDVAEIAAFPYDEGANGLERYARIVAKFAKHKLSVSGADHVQFACHSMGCLITRHLIENNIEELASNQKITRWFSSTGVIGGARLAHLFDNPTVQKTAETIGLVLNDFIHMNPDYVTDVTATWDHKLHEGNNPLFEGILIHHSTATDPKISEALDIQLLDLNNPNDEPNDGIMYTLDQHFWTQRPPAGVMRRCRWSAMSSRGSSITSARCRPPTGTSGR